MADDPVKLDDPLCDDLRLVAALRELRRPLDLGPGVDARLREALAHHRRRPGLWAWLRRPRTVRLSPLGALAAAAAVVVTTLLALPLVRHGGRDVRGGREIRFTLAAPGSARVAIVGDFNDWNPAATPLVRAAGGVWEVTVPLAPGRYQYTYVVDGVRWVADPAEPRALGDDFGTPTSVITVARR